MRVTLFLLTITVTLAAQTKLPSAAQAKVDFEKDVQPILAQKCHSCHGDEVQQSDFDWISARMRSAAAITDP